MFPFVTCSGRMYIPFFSSPFKRVLVRVKEHDRCLSCLAFGKRNFRRVFLNDPFFIKCYRSPFCKGWLWHVLCLCITSADLIFSIPLSRIVNAREVKRQRTRKNGLNRTIVWIYICYCPGSLGINEHYLFVVHGCYRCLCKVSAVGCPVRCDPFFPPCK